MSPLTVEQIQAAYARVARRDWPPLDELLRAVARYELVVGQALRSSRHLPPELRQQPEAAAPSAPERRVALPPRAHRPTAPIDRKSAAAGAERDLD